MHVENNNNNMTVGSVISSKVHISPTKIIRSLRGILFTKFLTGRHTRKVSNKVSVCLWHLLLTRFIADTVIYLR